MVKVPDLIIILFFGLCTYIPLVVFLMKAPNNGMDRESRTGAELLAFAVAVATCVVAMSVIDFAGIYNGYWIMSFLLSLAFGYIMARYIFQQVLPREIGEVRPFSAIVYVLGIGACEAGIFFFFWMISLLTGITDVNLNI